MSAHLARQRHERFELNVNLLGEMVLGDAEAQNRFVRTLGLVADPSVDYVSVKLSSIAAQLDLWSFDHTLERVQDRLRALMHQAATSTPVTFVNLDMEEYRDLELTLAAFMRVLDEPDLVHADAGSSVPTRIENRNTSTKKSCTIARTANFPSARSTRLNSVLLCSQ